MMTEQTGNEISEVEEKRHSGRSSSVVSTRFVKSIFLHFCFHFYPVTSFYFYFIVPLHRSVLMCQVIMSDTVLYLTNQTT